MNLDRIRYKKVEKVEEVPLSLENHIRDIKSIRDIVESLPTKDIDIEYVIKEEKDEGSIKFHNQLYKDDEKNNEQEIIKEEALKKDKEFDEFRVLLNSIKTRYGLNYLAKMTKEEEQRYIELYSKVYNVTKEYVQGEIDYAINDMYEKKINEINNEDLNKTSDKTTLDELMPILQEDGYTIFGHGTSYDNVDAVEGIFNNGLRASHTSMLYTTIGLDIPNKEVLQNKLDNWPHKESENVILIKLKNEYINMYGEAGDLNCERTGAFVNEVVKDERMTYYLDPKFIIGSYNKNTSEVTLNPKFENVYSTETTKEIQEKYAKTVKRTKERIQRQLESSLLAGYNDPIEEDIDNTFDEFNGPKF